MRPASHALVVLVIVGVGGCASPRSTSTALPGDPPSIQGVITRAELGRTSPGPAAMRPDSAAPPDATQPDTTAADDAEPPVVSEIPGPASSSGDVIATLMVEENPADRDGSAKARVYVTRDTRILRRGSQGIEVADPAALEQGRRVQVWYLGPVLQSYPARATGGVILVEL
jgi:hypothetical protein